jgi:hypothetical protein
VFINAIAQKYFMNRILALNLRLGAGITILYNFYFDFGNGTSPPFNSMMAAADAGLSLMWFFKKPFFAELGLDYIQSFSSDAARPGFIRPFIGAGYQF